MKRILMSLILMITVSISGFSQSAKAEEKAENKTDELAEWIEAGDESVALSEDQIKKIEDLYANMRMEINDLKDDYPDNKSKEFISERKKVSKKFYKQINKEVLTKKQRKAKRRGKKMIEDKS